MPPLDGRRIWFVGIGGAGLSAYATIAGAWGAEVGGWDRVETPYLAGLRATGIAIAPEPVVPEGWEVVVSSAGRRRERPLEGRLSRRARFAARRDLVAGAHGKTTTRE